MAASGAILLLAGLFISLPLIYVSIALIIVQPFFDKKASEVFYELKMDKITWAMMIYYLLIATSFFFTQNMNGYKKELLAKLPFLLLPIGFTSEVFKSANFRKQLMIWFTGLVFIVGFFTFIYYLIHFENLTGAILKAKPIPIITGLNHIYYSYFLAFAILTGLCLIFKGSLSARLKSVLIIITSGNLVFLHSISARSGLAAFYIALVVIAVFLGFKYKRYIFTFASLLVISLSVFAFLIMVKPLHNRMEMTLEDLKRYRSGDNINEQSLSMRFSTWEQCVNIFLESPVIGVGMADVYDEILQKYEEKGTVLLPQNRKGPHNQFLEVMVGMGVIGLINLLFVLIYPLKTVFKRMDLIFFSFLLVSMSVFSVESALERQAGISFFVFFLLLLNKKENKD